MAKLPSVSGTRVVRALKRAGFVELRQRGSHVSLAKQTAERTYRAIVPQAFDVGKRYVLSDILKQAGLTLEEFLDLL